MMLSVSAFAQLPTPRVDSSFPLGARAGSEVEVTLAGSDLADLSTLVFDTPGLTAAKVDGQKFRVNVAADCVLGLHEMRAVGRYGISTPRPFVVGDSPEFLDSGKNHTRETAMSIPAVAVVEGQADSEQRDVYKLTLSKGQAIHIACVACALDSPMDPIVTVADANGTTLARGDDERDRDAQFAFQAPADGDYFLVVHDKLFAGSAAHLYQLSLASTPSIIPLRQPTSAPDFNTAGGKEILETEPNDNPATAQLIDLPADVHGTFDNDWFSFKAEAGKALWVEVVADRDGHACDPVLVISKLTRDAQGTEQLKKVLELDDQAELPAPPRWQLGSRDPAGRFVPDESTTYRVRVVDRFARHGEYRLIVREASPDFALVALSESPANEDKKIFLWQPNMRRGGSAYFQVAALRRGYDGEITFRAEGLPSGVTMGGSIPAGAQTGWLVFHAAADAKPWAGYVRAKGGGGGVYRDAHGLTYRWNVDNRDNQRLDAHLCSLALSVVDEPAPLAVAPAEEKTWEAMIGGKLEIPLKLSRSGQPKGEWQLAPVGLPGLAKFDPLRIDGASANEAKLGLTFENKDGNNFVPGTYTFFLRARGTVAYKPDEKAAPKDFKDVEISTPITVKLTAPAGAPPTAAK
ncbi:PPC domain-containing protein [Verrucomicrobiota bacterium sgz303538]